MGEPLTTAVLDKFKPLADPHYYVKEEIDEEAMYHWWYQWDEKSVEPFFVNIWEPEYDDILKEFIYYCGESAFDYMFPCFYDIYKEYTVDYFIDDYTKSSAKTIRAYFLENKSEIFSPKFEKYPKTWKSVFKDLPPKAEYVAKIFNMGLNQHIQNRVSDLYRQHKIDILLRTRKCKISGELFTDQQSTSFKVRGTRRSKFEWDLQNYKSEIAPWLFDRFRRMGNDSDVKESIRYLRELLDLFGYLPPQNATTYSLFCNIPLEKFVGFIKLQPKVFYFNWYVDLYGGWLKAVKETGYLGDNEFIRSTYGYRTIANDGHICNSLAEKIVDDWLFANKIEHIKEPAYPDSVRDLLKSKVRADWLVGETYIEYFGLQTNEDYAKKTDSKILACQVSGVQLQPLYPGDEYHLDNMLQKLK